VGEGGKRGERAGVRDTLALRCPALTPQPVVPGSRASGAWALVMGQSKKLAASLRPGFCGRDSKLVDADESVGDGAADVIGGFEDELIGIELLNIAGVDAGGAGRRCWRSLWYELVVGQFPGAFFVERFAGCLEIR
jgi:hypothetical protein